MTCSKISQQLLKLQANINKIMVQFQKLSVPDTVYTSTPVNVMTTTTNIANVLYPNVYLEEIQTPSLPGSSSASTFCKDLGRKPTVIIPGKLWVPQDNHSHNISFEELTLDKMEGPQEKIVKTRK